MLWLPSFCIILSVAFCHPTCYKGLGANDAVRKCEIKCTRVPGCFIAPFIYEETDTECALSAAAVSADGHEYICSRDPIMIEAGEMSHMGKEKKESKAKAEAKAEAKMHEMVKITLHKEYKWITSKLKTVDESRDEVRTGFPQLVAAQSDEYGNAILLKKKYDGAVKYAQYAGDYLGESVFYKLYYKFNHEMIPAISEASPIPHYAMKMKYVSEPMGKFVDDETYYREWFSDWLQYDIHPGEWDYSHFRVFNAAQIAWIMIADRLFTNGDRINPAYGQEHWNNGNLKRKSIGTKTHDVQFVVPLDNSFYQGADAPHSEKWVSDFKKDLASIGNLREFFLKSIINPVNEGVFPIQPEMLESVAPHIADIMTYTIQTFGQTICSDETWSDLQFARMKLQKLFMGIDYVKMQSKLQTQPMNTYCMEKIEEFQAQKRFIPKKINWMQLLQVYVTEAEKISSTRIESIVPIGFNKSLSYHYNNHYLLIWICLMLASLAIGVCLVCYGFVVGGIVGYLARGKMLTSSKRRNVNDVV
eukprot:446064_1